ncbi:MAG: LLM class flavin-dependent oxidoreductase [Gammaproteobacteria bacterium]|nr:LLM class flavin-dependent oxidoreductase [Gammaproteobacteria bacterium]
MDIEIVLEPDIPPAQLAEIAVAAENYGIRALWASNFWAHWDGFISLVPAALATKTIELGVLAISPWEMHPLKIANAISSLNELSEGRSMVAIGAGGGMLAAMGKPLNPKKQRIVRAVREAIELVQSVASGERHSAYEGEIFQLTRPHHLKWIQHRPARIYACSTEDQMLRMGARVADSLQMSDATLRMLPAAMESIKTGLAKRDAPADDFRIDNFWAWHIKKDREVAMYEARRELIFRGSMLPPFTLHHFLDEDEEKLVIDQWNAIAKAFWTRSGVIEGVPEPLVEKLVAELSSVGTLDDIDYQIERFKKFEAGGLTDIAIRLFDDPMDGLKMIGERVVPEFS